MGYDYIWVPILVFVFFVALAFWLSGAAMADLEQRRK